MAGIEEAFEKFVTRVSSGEEPQSEYGDPQTGEKRIPIMQGIKRGYDFENTMPNIYNQRYGYENETPVYNDDRYSIPQQELAEGGVAGLQITSMRPTQQESAAGLVFNPGPYEGPYEGPYILGGPRPGQYYQSSPITAIRDPNVIALDVPGVFPRLETIPQVNVSTNPIAKALEMAGFTKEEIMKILGQQGLANGGRVSMSDGGLTTTVPPAKGPDSQGVESLFRRSYS
jgi:hypothetical protein